LVNNAEDIIRHMEELIQSPELRKKMGRAASKLVEENRGAVTLTMKLIANAMKNTPLDQGMQNRRYTTSKGRRSPL